MSDVMVIGVAGGTGSGKTTLVRNLIARFGDNTTVLIHDPQRPDLRGTE